MNSKPLNNEMEKEVALKSIINNLEKEVDVMKTVGKVNLTYSEIKAIETTGKNRRELRNAIIEIAKKYNQKISNCWNCFRRMECI